MGLTPSHVAVSVNSLDQHQGPVPRLMTSTVDTYLSILIVLVHHHALDIPFHLFRLALEGRDDGCYTKLLER